MGPQPWLDHTDFADFERAGRRAGATTAASFSEDDLVKTRSLTTCCGEPTKRLLKHTAPRPLPPALELELAVAKRRKPREQRVARALMGVYVDAPATGRTRAQTDTDVEHRLAVCAEQRAPSRHDTRSCVDEGR